MRVVPLPFGEPNPLQARAIELFRTGIRFVLLVSGRQGGKSHFGARWLLVQTMNKQAKHKLAFAVAPTYRMARVLQRKLEEVLKADPRLWKRIKHTKQPIPTYEFPNGWNVEVHSSDDPDSLRGPTVEAVWYDEVAKGSEESFDILTPTLLAANGRFLGTTTPRGKQNWVYRRIFLPGLRKGHPEYDPELEDPIFGVVTGSTWDNVDNLSKEAIEALERQYGKNSAFGRQEVAGEFVSYEGLVYRWDEVNFIPWSQVPDLTEFGWIVGGIDFGWTDPAAIIVLGYKDGMWWVLDGHYEAELPMNDLALTISELGQAYGVTQWFADSSRPEHIDDLMKRGLPVRAVKKPKIEDRIREMAVFASNNRLKVTYRAPFVRDELQAYQYPEQDKLLRDKNRNPVDKNNHAMDAIGYTIWEMRWLWVNDASYRPEAPTNDPRDDEEDPYITEMKTVSRLGGSYGPSGLAGR